MKRIPKAKPPRVEYPFRWEWDRRRYPNGWLIQCPTEAAVQKQILSVLALKNVLAFPVDAGAKAIRGRANGALMRAGMKDAAAFVNRGKAGGAVKGVVDICGTLPGGRSVYIEVKQPEWLEMSRVDGQLIQKRAAGKPTDEQLAFLLSMHNQGALCGLAWDISDVEAMLLGAQIDRAPPR